MLHEIELRINFSKRNAMKAVDGTYAESGMTFTGWGISKYETLQIAQRIHQL